MVAGREVKYSSLSDEDATASWPPHCSSAQVQVPWYYIGTCEGDVTAFFLDRLGGSEHLERRVELRVLGGVGALGLCLFIIRQRDCQRTFGRMTGVSMRSTDCAVWSDEFELTVTLDVEVVEVAGSGRVWRMGTNQPLP